MTDRLADHYRCPLGNDRDGCACPDCLRWRYHEAQRGLDPAALADPEGTAERIVREHYQEYDPEERCLVCFMPAYDPYADEDD